MIQPDLRLKGFDDKPFYWWAPGDGYGFLGEPRELAMPAGVRVVMTDPAWKKKYPNVDDPVMIVDLSGAVGRQLIVTHAPEAPQDDLSVPVPYIIRRDRGPGAGTFAKLIRLVDNVQADPIASFTQLHVEANRAADAAHAPPTAWSVQWKNGRRDVWVVADPSRDRTVTVSGNGIARLTTDGRVTFIQFAPSGKVERVIASQASAVRIDGGPTLKGNASLTGALAKIDPSASPARFEVNWKGSVPSSIREGALLLTQSPHAQASTWSVGSIDAKGATLSQITPVIASTRLIPVEGQAGSYSVETPISRFIVPSGDFSQVYAAGRMVYDGEKPVGRIARISQNGKSVKLISADHPLPDKPFEATILLASPGDAVIVPLELSFDGK